MSTPENKHNVDKWRTQTEKMILNNRNGDVSWTPCTINIGKAFIDKPYESHISNGEIHYITPMVNTKKKQIHDIVGHFNNILNKRKQDIKDIKNRLSDIQLELATDESNDESLDKALKQELFLNIGYIGTHMKEIKKIESNEKKVSVQFHDESVHWVLTRYIVKINKQCENIGFLDASQLCPIPCAIEKEKKKPTQWEVGQHVLAPHGGNFYSGIITKINDKTVGIIFRDGEMCTCMMSSLGIKH